MMPSRANILSQKGLPQDSKGNHLYQQSIYNLFNHHLIIYPQNPQKSKKRQKIRKLNNDETPEKVENNKTHIKYLLLGPTTPIVDPPIIYPV